MLKVALKEKKRREWLLASFCLQTLKTYDGADIQPSTQWTKNCTRYTCYPLSKLHSYTKCNVCLSYLKLLIFLLQLLQERCAATSTAGDDEDIVGAVVEGCNAIAKVIQEHPNENPSPSRSRRSRKSECFEAKREHTEESTSHGPYSG